jgi:glycerate 2-kinase
MSLASDALAIAKAGIAAADPSRAVTNAFRSSAVDRWLGHRRDSVHVVALGKGAASMTGAAVERLGPRFAGGISVVPGLGGSAPAGVDFLVGSHPLPTSASFHAGESLLAYVGRLSPADRVLFLLSGGGSSLAEAPAGGLGLSAVRRTTEALLASGAPIAGVNVVRRHLSALKGGRLAAASRAGRHFTFAISDVVGDRPEEIASGPTVADPTTFADAMEAVDQYRLADRLPLEVLTHLREGVEGRWPETVKPGDPALRRGRFQLVATNLTALRGAANEARRRGYRPTVLPGHLAGETIPSAWVFADRLLRSPGDRPVAVLAGGETSVTLPAHPGKGGRNQEFALASAVAIAGHRGVGVLSIGTDGIDGPTDAAGGFVDWTTGGKAERLGVPIASALAGHTSYDALERLGGLVRTGPTGTNVMDLHVGLRRRPRGR